MPQVFERNPNGRFAMSKDATGRDIDPFAMGYEACEQGLGRGDNTFPVGSSDYSLWDRGFVTKANEGVEWAR